MEVQGMDVALSELTAWVVANPTQGSVSAAINVRTPVPAVVAVIGVVVLIGVGALVTWGLPRQQGAELALTEDGGGGAASPQRPEPHA